MTLSRRVILVGGVATVLTSRRALAVDQRLLQNRLELWSNYARRTKNVMARLVTTRETSLLDEPLVTQGSMVFDAPTTLRDFVITWHPSAGKFSDIVPQQVACCNSAKNMLHLKISDIIDLNG